MRTLEFEKRLARINAFNASQEKIKRDRQYIPLEIDCSIDTTSNEWLMHCLAINIANKPTAQQRKSTLETLLSKNKPLYDQVSPVLSKIEALHFN